MFNLNFEIRGDQMYNEYLNENSDIAVTYQQIKDRLENIKKNARLIL